MLRIKISVTVRGIRGVRPEVLWAKVNQKSTK